MVWKMACTGILVISGVCVSMMAYFAFIQAGGIHTAGVQEKNVILVAAHDSPEASKVLADYTCNGTADQVEAQQAIDASRAGGAAAVSLAEGTFNLDGDLIVPGNTHTEGKDETRTPAGMAVAG